MSILKYWKVPTIIVGGISALATVFVTLDNVGARPVVNGEVRAVEERFQQQVGTLEDLVVQNERRYWEGQLAEALVAARRDPGNVVIEARIREVQETLREIQSLIRSSRS